MKKIIPLLLSFFIALSSIAQDNLFEALSPFDGQEFKVYDIRYNERDEIFYFEDAKYYNNMKITIAKNKANKAVGFNFLNTENNEDEGTYQVDQDKLDHYSQPAYSYSKHRGTYTYLMIDEVFYALNGANENMTEYGGGQRIGKAYVPLSVLNKKSVEEKEDKGGKKKVNFKGILKSLTESSTTAAPLPESLKAFKTIEAFKTNIDNYIAAMRKKQAANPYTAQEKQEIAAMEQEIKDIKAGIQKVNSDYWNSAEGQHVLNRENNSSMKVYNPTRSEIWLVDEDGYTTFVKEGLTFSISCNKKWYYSIGSENKPGEFIGGGSDSYCKQTITLKQ